MRSRAMRQGLRATVLGALAVADEAPAERSSPNAADASEPVAPSPPAATDATIVTEGGPRCDAAIVEVAADGRGSSCSCDAPCALETGRDRARTLAASSLADVVVRLRGGTYRLGHAFSLSALDSGIGGHSIVYRAADGERPVISGAIAVNGFAPVDASKKIWSATVPAATRSRQLYVDGRRAVRARGAEFPSGFTKTATGFALGDAAIAGWPDRGKLEVVGTYEWKMFRCPVSSISALAVEVAQPCWSASQTQAGFSFDTVRWLENARELLDEGGEFYLDEDAATLFYAPRQGEDLALASVELPVLESLLRGDGVHDVAFEGITFSHGTWLGPSSSDGYASLQATMTLRGASATLTKAAANVTMHATDRVRFTSCRFEHLGGAALAIEWAAHENVVEKSLFEDVSASAIMIGDVTNVEDHHPHLPELAVKDNTVRDTYVTRAGEEYWDAAGIFVGYTTHTTIAQNELFDLPYTGISAGWGWSSVDVGGGAGYATPTTSLANVIDRNLIGYHMRRLNDGGAIYINGAQSGTTITGNVVRNQGGRYAALYLDNGAQGCTVNSNVVFADPKLESPGADPDRSYWVYVQVFDPIAKNNSVTGNFATDVTQYTPKPLDPSNVVDPAILLGTDLTPVSAILAAAGTTWRSPEIALGKSVTASSMYDVGHAASAANDGNAFDGWSSTSADPSPYWQVDLGAEFAIDAFSVVPRWSIDQLTTRRNFRILASTDVGFTAPIELGAVGADALPHRTIHSIDVLPAKRARYVRVEKTTSEYFFLGEVRVHGTP